MELDKKALSIVKALALVENGGKLGEPKAGQSGELKSIFQFTPGTWKMYSKQVLGQEAPLNPQNEAAVVYGKVSNWLNEGFGPEEIASIWNSGRPDAYKKEWRGVNKYGVKYDTPAYVGKFSKYLASDSGSDQQEASTAPSLKPAKSPSIAPQIARTPTPTPSAADTLPSMMQRTMKQPRQI